MDNAGKVIEFSAQKNSVDLLMDDEDISIVSIDLFHIDKKGECNLNQCNISRKCADLSIPTFANKPLSFRFNSKFNEMVTDVVEHAHNENESFDMRVAGHIPPDSRIKFIERKNGKTYCNVEAIIQKRLLPKLIDIIKTNNGDMKVSIVFKALGEQDKETGIFNVDCFVLQEVTILSNKIQEGIIGSHLQVLKFSKLEQDHANEKYLQFSKNQLSTEDIFVKIKNKKEEILLNSLTNGVLEKRIWHKLRDYKNFNGNDKYWYQDVDMDKKIVIVMDNQTEELYSIPYKLSKEGDITLKEDERKKLEKDETYRQIENACEFLFAKEEYGTGNEIKVDKSKEAMSDTSWGKINKTTLRKDCLDAKNYKYLIKDIYVSVEDGWEDAPSEKLKYPIMEIKGDTAVYNRYGLASALTYAKANNEGAIISKIEGIYKKLEIDDEKVKEEKVENNLNKDKSKDKDDKQENEKPIITNNEKAKDEIMDKSNSNGDEPIVDEWESKYNGIKKSFDELTNRFVDVEKKLKEYQSKEDKAIMHDYLEQNKDVFDEESMKVMASKINQMQMSCEEFKKEVDDRLITYLKNRYSNEKKNDVKDTQSSTTFSFMADFTKKVESIGKKHNETLTSDEVLKKLSK